MAISRVRQTNAGSQGRAAASTWTLTLSGTPTTGNTLLLYIGSLNALSIASIIQGGSGSSWTSVYSSVSTGVNVYVYALYVTAGSNTTVTLNLSVANNGFYSICEEISGLVSGGWLDKSSNIVSTSTNNPDTGLTLATENSNEYWVNLYCFNLSSDSSQASSPTNGYTLYNSGTSINFYDPGWTGGAITPFFGFAGMIMAYKITPIVGNAGGSITDVLTNFNSYNSVALAFSGESGTVVASRRRVTTVIF